MRIGILQPGYLPWLGFFEQMYKSDIFILYDDVQYDKHGWRNRNRIKTPNGVQWLTVPVLFNLKTQALINEVKIDNKTNWRKKHFLSIKYNYSRSPFFNDYIGLFEEIYESTWEYLADLDIQLINGIAQALGLGDKQVIRSSNLGIVGDRIERLIKICQYFGADTFYEGAAGRNYINEEVFNENGIKVEFQEYKHPTYAQLYGEFQPYLSIIDLLFNEGKQSLSILIDEGAEGND